MLRRFHAAGIDAALTKVGVALPGAVRDALLQALVGGSIGAVPGALTGAITGGEDHRLEGALRGGLGGFTGGALGSVAGSMLGNSVRPPRQLTQRVRVNPMPQGPMHGLRQHLGLYAPLEGAVLGGALGGGALGTTTQDDTPTRWEKLKGMFT